MEKARICAPSSCTDGVCGFCRSRLVSGSVFVPPGADARMKAEKDYGYIHPCVTYPLSDAVIVIPEYKLSE